VPGGGGKVGVAPEKATKAQKRGREITLLFLLFPPHMGGGGSEWSTPRPGRYTPGKDPVLIV